MKPALTARELLALPIEWRMTLPGRWAASVQGVECALVLNNFPDEPLYTISVGDEALDLDDPPPNWSIERDSSPLS